MTKHTKQQHESVQKDLKRKGSKSTLSLSVYIQLHGTFTTNLNYLTSIRVHNAHIMHMLPVKSPLHIIKAYIQIPTLGYTY